MFLLLIDRVKSFHANMKGAISIIFAFVLSLMILLIGISVDYALWHKARNTTQAAMDAAVLAAGRALQMADKDDNEIIEVAKKYYDINKSKSITGQHNIEFSINRLTEQVIATSRELKTNTNFLRLLGTESMPINLKSISSLQDADIEVSLMLDTTGSMEANNKLANLKAASKDLIDMIVRNKQSRYKSRIALVPFSSFVNVGVRYFDEVTGRTSGYHNNRLTCVTERMSDDQYTDASPISGGYFKDLKYHYPSEEECPTVSTIMPLTDDNGKLKDHVDSLVADGSTSGHLGTAWVWYTLSSKWRYLWSLDIDVNINNYWDNTNNTVLQSPKVRQYAVMMTDGNYNTKFYGISSREQAREICKNMKETGIIVYTVGFDVPRNSSAEETMQHCASSMKHYYNASNGEELILAYRDIAAKIISLRLAE